MEFSRVLFRSVLDASIGGLEREGQVHRQGTTGSGYAGRSAIQSALAILRSAAAGRDGGRRLAARIRQQPEHVGSPIVIHLTTGGGGEGGIDQRGDSGH